MLTEEEKRRHRCCFTGHRPEKLPDTEDTVKVWLNQQIESAIRAGYTTFLCGMGMGVDIWAGEIVLKKRNNNPDLHLICAVPWPGFANRWSMEWQERYSALLKEADLVVPVSHQYRDDVFRLRNEWLVDHSTRLIAYYNGEPGGTMDMIRYALEKRIRVVANVETSGPEEGEGKLRETVVSLQDVPDGRTAFKSKVESGEYPANLLKAIGLERIFGKDEYVPLEEEQRKGLDHVLSLLKERDRELLRLRCQDGLTLREAGRILKISPQRAQQCEQRAIRSLRHPYRTAFIRNGFAKTELALKIACAEEMKRCLLEQKRRYPEMREEDVVKFAFQGMLGVGHLVADEAQALRRLREEMDPLEPDMEEPLAEKISPDWIRINLRAAKARGRTPEELAYQLYRSAQLKPLSFTRQNVYNFCVKLDPSDRMKAVAEKILDEKVLPSHSEAYRQAYAPAYRVMYKDYRKFRKGQEDAEDGPEGP